MQTIIMCNFRGYHQSRSLQGQAPCCWSWHCSPSQGALKVSGRCDWWPHSPPARSAWPVRSPAFWAPPRPPCANLPESPLLEGWTLSLVFRIGPPQVTLNLLLPELHSRWILVYHGYYVRKATKLPILNRMAYPGPFQLDLKTLGHQPLKLQCITVRDSTV